jgi:catechol 2,3-dioxygenase-like lactoylglutathione lyase family enzyme
VKLELILSVSSVERAATFYQALGFVLGSREISPYWAEMTCGESFIGLHRDDQLKTQDSGRVFVMLNAQMPLEMMVDQLLRNDIQLEREIADETFGRSIQVRDPDGMLIQINEHEPQN